MIIMILCFLVSFVLGCSGTVRANEHSIIIAASNSPSMQKIQAKYVCNGTNDEIQLQTAINAGAGGKITLMAGTYNKDSSAGIAVPSNTEIVLSPGAVINLRKLDADGCIFTNSDPVNGNTNIVITGPGSLNGNRHLSKAGDQYAVDFTHVTKSRVETYIDNFRMLEAWLNQSNCEVKNLRFENMPKNEKSIWRFNNNEMKSCRWDGKPISWEISTSNSASGNGCLKVVLDKDKRIMLYNDKWKKAGVVRDLRYENISFWLRFEGNYTPEQLEQLEAVVSVEFDGAPGYNTIKSNFPLKITNSLSWVRVFVCPWQIQNLNQDMSKITGMHLLLDTTRTVRYPALSRFTLTK